MSAKFNAINLNYDVGVEGVGVSTTENLTKLFKGRDRLEICSSEGIFDEIRVEALHSSTHDVEKSVVMGFERDMGVLDSGDGGTSLIKAVTGNFEVGEAVKSLDWVMKAAELLVGDGEPGSEIDLTAIAEDFRLLLKNGVANFGDSSMNPLVSQEENVLKLGQKEQVVLGNFGHWPSVEESVLIQNAVGSSSLQGKGVSYYGDDHAVSSFEPKNEPMKDETTHAKFQEKHLSKGADSKSSVNKLNGVNLLVDLNTYVSISGNHDHRNENLGIMARKSMPSSENPISTQEEEVKSGFSVSNLVWGKITSHPWWPGQIFNPSESSKEAMSYFKKDSFLIAYFGDGSFAWNEASKLKPFGPHFSHMENQSNMETFRHAVDCALDEVASRVEFGLSCSCLSLSHQSYSETKSQTVFNSGIKTNLRNRDLSDEYSNATSFEPVKLVDYIKELAKDSNRVIDRLEHVIAKSQVLSVSRWKGYLQLPEFDTLGGLLDNDAGTQMEVINQVPHEPSKPKNQNNSSLKRKNNSRDRNSSGKKKRKSLSDLMENKNKEKSAMSVTVSEMLTQLRLSASNPMKRFNSIVSEVSFFAKFRNSIGINHGVVSEQQLLDNDKNEDPALSPKVEPTTSYTALILNFTDTSSIPLEENLNKIFSQYGPLNESQTSVLNKSKRAKVVFKRRDDAETAFSSAGKYSVFGPSLVSYRLKYMSSTTSRQKSASKRRRKTSGDANNMKVK